MMPKVLKVGADILRHERQMRVVHINGKQVKPLFPIHQKKLEPRKLIPGMKSKVRLVMSTPLLKLSEKPHMAVLMTGFCRKQKQ